VHLVEKKPATQCGCAVLCFTTRLFTSPDLDGHRAPKMKHLPCRPTTGLETQTRSHCLTVLCFTRLKHMTQKSLQSDVCLSDAPLFNNVKKVLLFHDMFHDMFVYDMFHDMFVH